MNTYYDIIVSNPPYFEDGPTKSDHGIAAARHALTLDFKSLVMSVSGLLKPNGSFWAILPCDRKDRFLDALERFGKDCFQTCDVFDDV